MSANILDKIKLRTVHTCYYFVKKSHFLLPEHTTSLFCCCIGMSRRSSSWVKSASSCCLKLFDALKNHYLMLQCVYLCLMLPRGQHLHLHSKFWNHRRVCPCWTASMEIDSLPEIFSDSSKISFIIFGIFQFVSVAASSSFAAGHNLFWPFFRVSSATLKIAYLIL